MLTWVKRFGQEIVIETIGLAEKYNGQTFRYVERTLLEWVEADVQVVDDVVDYEASKGKACQGKKQRTSFFKNVLSPSQSVFDLMRAEVGV